MEAHRAIIQQAIKNINVVILSLLEVDNHLCIVLEAQIKGFSFWSDGVNLPKNGTFVLDGKTGAVVRGGRFIRRVTATHCLDTLPWPSDDHTVPTLLFARSISTPQRFDLQKASFVSLSWQASVKRGGAS